MSQAPAELAFLASASPTTGHGHVARCLTLARTARARQLRVEFWTLDDYTADLLRKLAPDVAQHAADGRRADYLVWDVREDQSAVALRALRRQAGRILSLDELGEARLEADVVVDALMTPRRAERYPHGDTPRYAYGLEYVLIERPCGPPSLPEPGVVIAFGGVDPMNLTQQLVHALHAVGFRGPATIATGVNNPQELAIRDAVTGWDAEVHEFIPDLPAVIAASPLLATKLGITTFEAFAAGVPCVLIEPTQAHEQLTEELRTAHERFAAWTHGLATPERMRAAARALVQAMDDVGARARLGEQGRSLVDYRGPERVLDLLTERAG